MNKQLIVKRVAAVFAGLVGVFGILLGVILCLTIIGALLGIPMFIGGCGFLLLAISLWTNQPMRRVKRPHLKRVQ